jgi:CcmD family protein
MDAGEFQFLFAGFYAAWIVIVIYVLTLTFRNRRLRRELDRIRKMLEKMGKRAFFTRGEYACR